MFIKNDKWPKRLKVPVQGKMEKQCKPQEGGLKCGGAAELVELPGHKSLSSSHLCAGWAKQRPFLLHPGIVDGSVGPGHCPQVSRTNTTAVVTPWPFGDPSGDGRNSWVVVLCLHFFLEDKPWKHRV